MFFQEPCITKLTICILSVCVLPVCFSRIYLRHQNIFLVLPISLFSMNPQPHFLSWIHMKTFGNTLHDFLGNFKSRHVKVQNYFGLVSPPLFTYAGWAQVVTVSRVSRISRCLPAGTSSPFPTLFNATAATRACHSSPRRQQHAQHPQLRLLAHAYACGGRSAAAACHALWLCNGCR
jgi:hypothetical protein